MTHILSEEEILKRLSRAGAKRKKQLITKLLKRAGVLRPFKHIQLSLYAEGEFAGGGFGDDCYVVEGIGFRYEQFDIPGKPLEYRVIDTAEGSEITDDSAKQIIINLLNKLC